MISADEIYDSALHTFANEANAVAKLADTVDRELRESRTDDCRM